MKYRAVVEIEFETDDDPLDTLHRIMRRTSWSVKLGAPRDVEHYHILEQPKEMP